MQDGWDIAFLNLLGYLTSTVTHVDQKYFMEGIIVHYIQILNEDDQRHLAVIVCSNRQMTLA